MGSLQLLGSDVQKPKFELPLSSTELFASRSLLGRSDRQTFGLIPFVPRTRQRWGRVTRGYRSTEVEWRRMHEDILRPYAGQWVVLEGNQIVAHSFEPTQAVNEARARGVRVPYVFRVEEANEDIVPIGL